MISLYLIMNWLFFFISFKFIVFSALGEGIECPPEGTSIIADPDDCSKYWECDNGNGYQFVCPTGLLWNQELQQCDYPANVDCASTNQPTITTTDSGFTPNPLCPYPSENVTFLSDPDDCSKYYECYEGVLNIMECQEGLLWNQDAQTCDYPENVICTTTTSGTTTSVTTTSETTTTETTSTTQPQETTTNYFTTPIPFICPYPSDIITVYPYPENCAKYYECYDGVLTVKDCPENKVWNNNLKHCDFSEYSTCDKTLTTPEK